MNTYALPALKQKRAVIHGRILTLKAQITRHEKELASLDTTIALFDASYKVGSIKPKRTRKRAKIVKQGELGRHIIDALRRAGDKPLSSFEVTVAVCHAIGEGDNAVGLMGPSVRSNLQYLVRKGKIQKQGNGQRAEWLLPITES
jgi:hypothetical protein